MSLPVALLVLAAPAAALAEGPLEGTWETPYGRVKIEVDGGQVRGKLVEPGRVCGFARSSEVLRGRQEGTLFTGEMRECFEPNCHDEAWSLAFALAVHGPERIVGALPPPSHTCRSGVWRIGRTFSFTRARSVEAAPLPPPIVVPPPPPPILPVKGGAAARPPPPPKLVPEAKALFDEAVKLVQEGYFERAQKKLARAADLDPKNPIIWLNLGVTYKVRGELEEARRCNQKAIALDPRFGDAYYNLACILALEGKTATALEMLRAAMKYGYGVADLSADSDLATLRGVQGFDELQRVAAQNFAARGGR